MSVENLNKMRAEKKGDSRLWTALDALREMIRLIEEGEVKPPENMCIWYSCALDDGSNDRELRYMASGMTFGDHILTLALAQDRIVREFRRD